MCTRKSGEGCPPLSREINRGKLFLFFLLFFLFWIALFADFFVFCGFNAAFVAAFLARFLGVIAAARLQIRRAEGERESANDQTQELDALHYFLSWCQITGCG